MPKPATGSQITFLTPIRRHQVCHMYVCTKKDVIPIKLQMLNLIKDTISCHQAREAMRRLYQENWGNQGPQQV